MKQLLATLLAVSVMLVGAAPLAVAGAYLAKSVAGPSLYTRLGGYDALVAVTKDFIGRLATDPTLAKFFTGLNDTSKARVEAHVIDFLCVATGGPCIYTGQDMRDRPHRPAYYGRRLERLGGAPDGDPQQVQSAAERAERSDGCHRRTEEPDCGTVKEVDRG